MIWVAGLIVSEGRVLLLHRSNTGFGDGFWSLPGGKIDSGEKPSEAIKREIFEEIGIDATYRFSCVVHYTDFVPCSQADEDKPIIDLMGFFFCAQKWVGSIENKEPHKHSDLKWFPLEALPSNLLPIGKIAIANYLNDLPYSEAGFVRNSASLTVV